jgi:adenylate cyclase
MTRDLSDIFAVQDEITEAVTIAIAPVIADAEQQRAMRKPPGSLDTWAAYQRGLWHLSKFTADDLVTAQEFFQQAIRLDSAFAGGYIGLSSARRFAAVIFRRRGLSEAQGSAETLARKAVVLDGGNAEARLCLGGTLFGLGDYEGAFAETERALGISPNLAPAHAQFGVTLIYSGRVTEGLATLERYFRLDPRDPFMAVYSQQQAVAHYFLCDYEAAMAAARRTIRAYPDYPNTYRWLAAALGQLDRIDEAQEALGKGAALAPAAFDESLGVRAPWYRAEDHAHMLEGLRKAGWRET